MINEKNFLTTKRGYLKGNFLFSHIKDQRNINYELHYHDFNKVIIFISGNVTYIINGKVYRLKPWDILYISSSEVHMPVIDPNEPYERVGIWVSSRFLEKYSRNDSNLFSCFEITHRQKFNLLRLSTTNVKKVREKLKYLEEKYKNTEPGNNSAKDLIALEIVTYFNNLLIENEELIKSPEVKNSKNVDFILNYINDRIMDDLSIEDLSKIFNINKYYLMHKFKMITGYTIHNYINQKRLIMADSLIINGKNLKEACLESGFKDYSSFARIFKKTYGSSPGKYYNVILNREA